MARSSEVPTAATMSPVLLCPLEHERRGLISGGMLPSSIEVCGPGREGVRRWADRHADLERPVIMVGLAGGLDPELTAGTVVVAGEIVDGQGRVVVPPLVKTLGLRAPVVRFTTAGRLVASPEAKLALRRSNDAAVVDLESTHFAEVARVRDWTWGVVRVIVDEAGEPVPTALERLVDHRGRTRPIAVATEVFRRPTLAPVLRRMRAKTRLALESLADALGRIAPLEVAPTSREPGRPTPIPSTSTAPPVTLVFGGTFDPPHRGHLTLPFEAARRLGCRELVFVPARVNPLKVKTPPTEADLRIRMLEAAIEDHRREIGDHDIVTRISRVEVDRDGPSYMIDTLRTLHADLMSAAGEAAGDPRRRPRLRLLIGSDQALDFTRWRDWRDIVALAPPVVMPRPPATRATLARAYRERFPSDLAGRWATWTLDLPTDHVSSTDVRKVLGEGGRPMELLSQGVLDIIDATGIYRSTPEEPRNRPRDDDPESMNPEAPAIP